MFLIAVDAFSKWPKLIIEIEMRSTTSNTTINTLRTLFARQGIPAEIVSDNGPQFRSEEFHQFMESNAIRHITSSPFHPRTNGQAERITPQGTTNESPSILLYGRNIRTRLDIMKPDVATTVLHKQYGSTALRKCDSRISDGQNLRIATEAY
ncbi:uncharacterized protein K02A2.6-like [Saccostrea cucullata]|uniref:uncharacterized protein K02A2.6-like n=1 Tax=Saccostrea cuccullata TaxID=36930 RepID=UPI002ED29078